jgi:hypothetical protein
MIPSAFSAIVLLLSGTLAAPQFNTFPHRPHPAVIKNAQQESRLPSILRNPFYQDPRTARALAQHSYLGPGEQLVRLVRFLESIE